LFYGGTAPAFWIQLLNSAVSGGFASTPRARQAMPRRRPSEAAEHLFTFLRVPGVQATNWRAEQAIRSAVVTRKSWGGNRTWTGADTWQVLTSVLRTATQQARDPSSCSPAFCKRRHRSWPTSPSPGADEHTRYLNTRAVASRLDRAEMHENILAGLGAMKP
jgi:hypothetical protein